MRKSSEFNITKDGKTQTLLVQPEEKGYSIWIDKVRKYVGQSFTESELADRFYYIGRQYTIESVGKAPRWFQVSEVRSIL